MSSLRRLALLTLVAAGFAVLSGPALAAYPRDASLPFYVESQNFRVHYQSDTTALAWAITQTRAGDIAALGERALAAETADGYPRPESDGLLGGNDKIDIYVEDYSTFAGVLGAAGWDFDNPTSSGFIELAGDKPDQALGQHAIAHELFHLIQFSIWRPTQGVLPPLPLPSTVNSDMWLYEATAEWMGFRVNGYPSPSSDVVPMDMALDCRDPLGGTSDKCDLSDAYLGGGYSRWPFFEYLIENYGAGFVKNIFAKGAAGSPTAIQALADALAAAGTTLADTYDNWVAADVRGGYSVPTLQAKDPEVYGVPLATGPATNPKLPRQTVTVNHLSTRILQFDRGGGSATGTCYAATLTISVSIPAGTSSKPIFYWNVPGTPVVPLAVSGGTATATVPWDTCQWPSAHGYLVLPNASTSVDAVDFVVDSSIKVDTSNPTSAISSGPPPAVVVTTPVIQAPTGDVAPTLSVFGPQLFTLSSTVKQIRLIIESTGSGSVQASLGGLALGVQPIRIGNNDVRFSLPDGVLQSLRRSAASTPNVLTLTPVSPSGTAGQPVTRQVRIDPVARTKVKAKAKTTTPKLKPKPKPKKTSRK